MERQYFFGNLKTFTENDIKFVLSKIENEKIEYGFEYEDDLEFDSTNKSHVSRAKKGASFKEPKYYVLNNQQVHDARRIVVDALGELYKKA